MKLKAKQAKQPLKNKRKSVKPAKVKTPKILKLLYEEDELDDHPSQQEGQQDFSFEFNQQKYNKEIEASSMD